MLLLVGEAGGSSEEGRHEIAGRGAELCDCFTYALSSVSAGQQVRESPRKEVSRRVSLGVCVSAWGGQKYW